jgi:hypothetical protein
MPIAATASIGASSYTRLRHRPIVGMNGPADHENVACGNRRSTARTNATATRDKGVLNEIIHHHQ